MHSNYSIIAIFTKSTTIISPFYSILSINLAMNYLSNLLLVYINYKVILDVLCDVLVHLYVYEKREKKFFQFVVRLQRNQHIGF